MNLRSDDMKKCVKIVVAVVATLFVACLLGLIITGAKID